jgi:hypothetical protein|uniref:Uncharacterized protein n=1 Tax=Haptolina ericina TaxID=156174 RepID=A0A7S3BSW8_9EUKA
MGIFESIFGRYPSSSQKDEEFQFVGGVALLGRLAVVQHLTAKPELNGRVGKLVHWHPADPMDPNATNRFEVEVLGAGTFKLKLRNLHLLDDKAGDLRGQSVRVCGLWGRSELNGSLGRVVRLHAESGRFEVLMDTGESMLMKQANLKVAS